MIVYHGSMIKFERFSIDTVVQKLSNDIDTIGFWFTSDINSAKLNATGTETVIQKSDTEFWQDREPKVVQIERPVMGYIYKVYMDDPNLKEYSSYDLFMTERDQYCDYLGSKKRTPTWQDGEILLNKEEANAEFRHSLVRRGYEGFFIHNAVLLGQVTDLYCMFSGDSLFIADVIKAASL